MLNFRLGYHGAFHDLGIRADLTCLGKIIGGGFPVGAVGGREDVMAVFDHTRRRSSTTAAPTTGTPSP